MMGEATGEILLMRLRDRQSRFWRCGFSGLSGRVLLTALFGLLTAAFLWQPLPAAAASDTEASAPVSSLSAKSSPVAADGRRIVRIGYVERSFMPEERPDILATFAWLKKKLPQYQIEIRNYTIPGLEYAIRHGEVDFFLETAGFYRRVYVQGLRDIATMITREAPNPSEAVGSLILVPYDSPYKSIEDLKGKRAAVSWIEAFSGVYIPEGELAARGLSPDHYFHYVEAGSPMTNLLAAVQRGDADFALARTCTFEQLESTTPEYAKQFRAVSLKKPDAVFHCRTSTDLYPYWTFISTQTATAPVSRAVTVALLTMPETSHGVAWGVVSDFARVDGLFRTLKAGPYAYLRVESVGDFVRKYRTPILFGVLLILLLIFHSWRSGRLVEERTAELEKSRLAEEAATRRKLEAEKKLETFERVSVIGAISSLITHELNGPLSTISNCCDTLPIIFLTGHGDIDTAVFAIRAGAEEFLQKPMQPDRLLTTVARSVQKDCDSREHPIDEAEWKSRFGRLTTREREIIRLAAKGLLNRQIAAKLDISERTVQVHRLSAYRKLDVHNTAELAPITVLLERGKLGDVNGWEPPAG